MQALPDDNSEINVFEAENVGFRKVFVVIICAFILAFLRVAYVAAGTTIMSGTYRLYGVVMLLISASCVLCSMWLLLKQINYIRFVGRYNRYADLLKYKNTEIIDDLSHYVKIPSGTVEKDLEYAVNYKLIPEGHFGTDNRIILLSDKVYQQYKANQARYDYYYKRIWEEHRRIEERPAAVAKLLEEGNAYVFNIRTSNELIKNRDVSRQLDHMERTVKAIFYEVDMDASQTDKIGTLLYIYLPAIEKLLNAYIEIDEKQTTAPSAKKAKSEISESLKSFNKVFDKILNQFYEEKELDIASDIASIQMVDGLEE